jgi:hypothetical protein
VKQTVYVCDLLPGYDPRTWRPYDMRMSASKASYQAYEASVTQVAGACLQEGDLFTFLDRLIEREGDVD